MSVEPASDDLLFSEVYHSLIHSQSLDTLLGLDDTYCGDMQKLLTERDRNITTIEKRSVTSYGCLHTLIVSKDVSKTVNTASMPE